MGKRGPLPSIEFSLGDELQDTSPPDWLSSESRQFWLKHRDTLLVNKLLNERTADNFALCCELWGEIRSFSGDKTSTKYRKMVQEFGAASRVFRLLPTEKGGRPADDRLHKGEFEEC